MQCNHRYIFPRGNLVTGKTETICATCGVRIGDVEAVPVADMSQEMQKALEQIDGIDIPSFTVEDTEAIASLPLGLIKALVTEAQFAALVKFVNINQMVTGITQGKPVDA